LIHKDQENQGADVRGKHSGLKRGKRIESGKSIQYVIRLASVELEISRSCIQRMLRKDIKAFPYNLQTVHKLEEEDNNRRVKMCETLLNHYKDYSSILDNIWLSDEAVFHLSGRVNRCNTRILGTENPKLIEEKERA